MKTRKVKIFSLGEITDKYIGKPGTLKRDVFDYELRMELFGRKTNQGRAEKV